MDNLDFVELHIFRVTPKHCQNKVVHWRNWLVHILEEHVQKVLQIEPQILLDSIHQQISQVIHRYVYIHTRV